MAKIKCPECKCCNFEEGDTEIDYDKGTYKIKCRCNKCGNWLEVMFSDVKVKLI